MIAYTLGDSLYLNITNRCSNACSFCIRNTADGVGGHYLWLSSEPSAEEIIQAIGDPSGYKEVVFCGFGEPLMRVDAVRDVAAYIKSRWPNMPIRVNTNGHANLIHGRNVVPELKGLIDVMSISLNAESAGKYVAMCRPRFGAEAYQAVLDFARECKGVIPKVVLSVVDVPEVDVESCRRIAEELGVEFRVRHYEPRIDG